MDGFLTSGIDAHLVINFYICNEIIRSGTGYTYWKKPDGLKDIATIESRFTGLPGGFCDLPALWPSREQPVILAGLLYQMNDLNVKEGSMTMKNGKANIDDSEGRLIISIPSRKDWALLLFGTVWLMGWLFGVISYMSTFSSGSSGSFSIGHLMNGWFIAWTSFGLGLTVCMLWGYFGKEILEISQHSMRIEKSIFGFGLKECLDLAGIKNIRFEKISDSNSKGNRWAFWGLGSGKVKFDYGVKCYSFGISLADEEAIYLANLLKEKIEKTISR